MSSHKKRALVPDKYDSRILYSAIVAIAITYFIVRIKVFTNVRFYDMSMLPSVSNIFSYYKLVWIVSITICLVILLFYRLYKYKTKLECKFPLLGISLIIIASIISYILDPIKAVSIWGIYSRTNGLISYISLFLLIYLVSSFKVQTKHLAFLLHTVNVVSIILAIIGVFQFFGLNIMNSLWFKSMYTPNEYKHMLDSINTIQIPFKGSNYYWADSLFGQPNYYGAYCSMVFPLITIFSLHEKVLTKKVLLIIGSIMMFSGTILAQSMGSIITLFIILFMIPVFLVRKDNYRVYLIMCAGYVIIGITINILTNMTAFQELYNIFLKAIHSKAIILVILSIFFYILCFVFRNRVSKHRYKIIAILMIAVILLGTVGFIYLINNITEKNMNMLSHRGYIWHYSNELIKQQPLFGYGPDNLYYNFPQTTDYQLTYMPNTAIDKPHNMYLQVMLDTGIFGLVGFMIVLIGILLRLNKAIEFEKDPYISLFFKALIFVIFAYMFQGLVNDNHLSIQPITYLLLGMGASLSAQTLK